MRVRPNTIDSWVAEQVIKENEYQIGDLHADTRVVDIGAHIGEFTVVCYAKGSRNIQAYEVAKDNFELLSENTEGLCGISCFNVAAWRSDAPEGIPVRFTGHGDCNTGDGNTVFSNAIEE